MDITPLHDVTDSAKVSAISASMDRDGWTGRPILAIHRGDHLQAITGTHRLAAAAETETEPDVYIISEPPYTGDDDQADLFAQLIDGDDDDRRQALAELTNRGDVPRKAYDIMQAESL